MAVKAPPILGTAAGPAGELYENALVALIELFGVGGEQHWQDWMREDLRIWRTEGRTEHHRRAYGGMGSLNDRTLGDDPWLDAVVIELIHVAVTASVPAGPQPTRFVQISATSLLQPNLSWYRCGACGSGYVTEWDAEAAAATGWASWVVPRRLTGSDDEAWWPGDGRDDESRSSYVQYVDRRIADLGLTRCDIGRYWETPCPSCGERRWRHMSSSVF
jgi:hypothetical protein